MTEQITSREPTYWACNAESEHISSRSIKEEIERWADDLPAGQPVPDSVIVYGFAEAQLPSAERLADGALAYLIESLDEDYGDPDGVAPQVTGAMKSAAIAFAEIVRTEYTPWVLDKVCTQTVRVRDYLAEDQIKTIETDEEVLPW